MSDRELLELASKAAGYRTDHPWNEHRKECKIDVGLCIDGVSTNWNPLTADSDALRLAVKLKINIILGDDLVGVIHSGWSGLSEKYKGDPHAATRRAIVRAAAEIGKAMP